MPLLMLTSCHPSARRRGFSLIELSVVIAIVAVTVTLGLEMAASYAGRNAYDTARSNIASADAALREFVRINGRLPCPADPALTPISTRYGIEDCTLAALAAPVGGGVVPGAVPFRTLNVSIESSVDGFGNKLNYYVTKNLMFAGTGKGQFGHADASNPVSDQGLAGIEIRTGRLEEPCTNNCSALTDLRTSASPVPPFSVPYPKLPLPIVALPPHIYVKASIPARVANMLATPPFLGDNGKPVTLGAAYAIFSNGADGRGAYPRNSGTPNTCFVNPSSPISDLQIDSKNCSKFTSPASWNSARQIPQHVLYDSRFSNGTDPANYFDDVLLWRPKEDL